MRFFDRFAVDRAGFEFQRYFPVERFRLFANPFRPPLRPPPLTLGILAKAVERGRWPEEPAG